MRLVFPPILLLKYEVCAEGGTFYSFMLVDLKNALISDFVDEY